MENASTGQMRSSNPPPGCGAGCAGVRRSRFGVWPHGKVHSAQPVGCRMRFSVRPPLRVRFSVRSHTQSALFRETASRLPSSGKAHSTERRILCRHPHGKAHPRPATSRKSALWTRSVPRRDPSLTEKRTLRSTLPASPCRTLRVPRHAPLPCALLGMHCDVGDNAVDPPRSRYPTPAGYTNHHETRWYTVSAFGPARSYYV